MEREPLLRDLLAEAAPYLRRRLALLGLALAGFVLYLSWTDL